ncbi:hypothetical protein S83_051074, partial [Arachis hypogaea]
IILFYSNCGTVLVVQMLEEKATLTSHCKKYLDNPEPSSLSVSVSLSKEFTATLTHHNANTSLHPSTQSLLAVASSRSVVHQSWTKRRNLILLLNLFPTTTNILEETTSMLTSKTLSCLSSPNPTPLSPSKHAMFPPSFSSVSRRCFLLSTPPTHPPFALMIHRAISELNENKGSTEEEISNFIVKEYEDLPWAHKKILGIQLEKLCQDEEIVCNEGGRYVLQADGDGIDGDRKGRQECKSKRKKRGKKTSQHSMDGGGERKRKRVKICE